MYIGVHSKKLKNIFLLDFKGTNTGLRKKNIANPKRKPLINTKKENKYMKLEATFVIENSIREDQIEFATESCGDRYSKESTLAEKVRQDVEMLFSELSGQKDFNGVPTKVTIKDVKVYFDDGVVYSEDKRNTSVPRGSMFNENSV